MIQPHYRIFACFFGFALALGTLLSRLPDLQVHFELTESQLGLMLIAFSFGSLVALTVATPWIARLGARNTAGLTVLGTAALYAVLPWLPTAPVAFVVMLAIGFLVGMLEINLNVESAHIEALHGRRVMNRAHGSWSLGFFVAALAGAAVRQTGMSIHLHTILALVVATAIVLIFVPGMQTTPIAPGAIEHRGRTHRIALPNFGLLPLCIIGIAAFLIEGAGVDWSTIYMRDVFAPAPFVGGLGLTLFTGFMAFARLCADGIVDRFGPRLVVIVLLAIGAAGTALVWLAPDSNVALIGFALMGVGCSGVYPLAVTAAAQRTDRPAAVNVAALGQVAFVTFFLAPPLLGFIAQYFGIRYSFAVVLPVIALGLLLSGAVAATPKPQPRHA